MQIPSSIPLTLPFVALLSFLGSAQALGINCDGNSKCGSFKGAAQTLSGIIQGISDNTFFNNGQQIACFDGAICAFLQNTAGSTGNTIKQLAPLIVQHGCSACGSVPFFFPQGNNNVDQGELTFNFVTNPCRGNNGLC